MQIHLHILHFNFIGVKCLRLIYFRDEKEWILMKEILLHHLLFQEDKSYETMEYILPLQEFFTRLYYESADRCRWSP